MFYGAYIFVGMKNDDTIGSINYFPFKIRDLKELPLNNLTVTINDIPTNVLTKEGRKLFGLEEGNDDHELS